MSELERLLRQCYSIVSACNGTDSISADGWCGIFRNEILHLCYILAAIDDNIDKYEINAINSVFNLCIDGKFLQERFGDEDSNAFVNTVPRSIIATANLEKKSKGGIPGSLLNTRILYNFVKRMGMAVIVSNSMRLLSQLQALERFERTILNFIMEIEAKDEILEAMRNSEVKHSDFNVAAIDNMDQVEKIMDEVKSMIGLENVKIEISNMVNLLMVKRLREERGYKVAPVSKHLVFTGNPGTGKTTVARKIAEIYKSLGIVDKGTFIETDRAGMVSGYMGQTAEKVSNLVSQAMGGVLFIDEAYTLAEGQEGDYGQEAIDTLLKVMEDERENLVVIVAGYPDRMENFLSSNPGLRSRFSKIINFEDYSSSQLFEIFMDMCKEQDYIVPKELEMNIKIKIAKLVAEGDENFANAREIRNYFEEVVTKQAGRIMRLGRGDINSLLSISEEDL